MHVKNLVDILLSWYDKNSRTLPWRSHGGLVDPYQVWLSEIMLQQTTVETVKPYFERFIARWPTIADLASASIDEVLHAWQGLGYYSRAHNLHKCALQITKELHGKFPREAKALMDLPGIGPYTAAAVAAISFGQRILPVDGNIKRVLARLFEIDQPFENLHDHIDQNYQNLADHLRPGDSAQAFMDLGATVCKPKSPLCNLCPLNDLCLSRNHQRQLNYPRPKLKKTKPVRQAVTIIVWEDGNIYLKRRPARGLLAGLIEVPTLPSNFEDSDAWLNKNLKGDYLGEVKHTFTHFHLKLKVYSATPHQSPAEFIENAFSWPVDRLCELAIPTVFKKVLDLFARKKAHELR